MRGRGEATKGQLLQEAGARKGLAWEAAEGRGACTCLGREPKQHSMGPQHLNSFVVTRREVKAWAGSDLWRVRQLQKALQRAL